MENLNHTRMENCFSRNGSQKSVRDKIEDAWLSLLRVYTFNTPIAKGKYRLMQLGMHACVSYPKTVESELKDGRRISLAISPGIGEAVYFLGEYEKEITAIVNSLVKDGDVCIDVGANFGWYTTLLRRLCGETGEVHTFEPVPSMLANLKRNYELMGSPRNVFINNSALGDYEGEASINVFSDGPGFSSLSAQGRKDTDTVSCAMTTLDSYLTRNLRDKHVNFVKVDIEGAELMFLKGAQKLFDQRIPPVMLIEMAAKQSRSFGYAPDDLVKFIAMRAQYDFYAVNEYSGYVKRIEGFDPDDIGANVFCIPKEYYSDRLDLINERLV